MSVKITDYEQAQYGGALSSVFITDIANLTTQFARFMEITAGGFYLQLHEQGVAVMHGDGWRAGFLKPDEDWYTFVPSYQDLND